MATQFDTNPQRPTRIPVEIPVAITSVLVSGDAMLRDLTEYGAMIEGMTLPKGTQFQIEYRGQTVFGFVIWTESDRFGARFPFTLHEGPLHDALDHARIAHEMDQRGVPGSSMLAGIRRPPQGFGRRGAN